MSPVWISCYCAFCKSKRRVYNKRHVRLMDAVYAASLGILVSLLFWQEIDFKFIPLSVSVLSLMEVFVQVRWRMSLPCQKCGFDPIIYLRSPQKAAQKVRIHFDKRLEDPTILVKKLPIMFEQRAAVKSYGHDNGNKI